MKPALRHKPSSAQTRLRSRQRSIHPSPPPTSPRSAKSELGRAETPTIAIAILAGGLSQRMGRDKANLRLGRRTFLQRARSLARTPGWPVHVIRKDLIPGCGPLGGIHTAFERASAQVILFLPCDMPFLDAACLGTVYQAAVRTRRAVFTYLQHRAGFPFLLWRHHLRAVQTHLRQGTRSLQALAKSVRAHRLVPPRERLSSLTNINAPDDYHRACFSVQIRRRSGVRRSHAEKRARDRLPA